MRHSQSFTQRKSIPLFEPWFPPSYADAVREQVLSGFVGPGRATGAFADALACFAGAGNVLLTSSGTVALSVAARAGGWTGNIGVG
jgi:dTDP-4-amino-4,6-dideoxygalactose transaminase